LRNYDLSDFFQVPLTYDDNKIVVPKVLEDLISTILNTIKKNDKPKDMKLLERFMEEAKKLEPMFSLI